MNDNEEREMRMMNKFDNFFDRILINKKIKLF
jgi:hypothetical protein